MTQLQRGLFLRVYLFSPYVNPVVLLLHGPAVGLILIGRDHLPHIDPDRGQDAVQLLLGLLGQGGLSAQNPGQLSVEGPELCAAVDQRVAFVVCGQHPVGTWGRGCEEWGERLGLKTVEPLQQMKSSRTGELLS